MLLYCHLTVASAVNRKVHTVVASIGIIRVTVTIGDYQARVSSSSEEFRLRRKQSRWNLINLDYSIERS